MTCITVHIIVTARRDGDDARDESIGSGETSRRKDTRRRERRWRAPERRVGRLE